MAVTKSMCWKQQRHSLLDMCHNLTVLSMEDESRKKFWTNGSRSQIYTFKKGSMGNLTSVKKKRNMLTFDQDRSSRSAVCPLYLQKGIWRKGALLSSVSRSSGAQLP